MEKHKNKVNKQILTLYGKIDIKRTKLYDKEKKVTCVPKDEFLEIDRLPYKVTIPAMDRIAYIGQNEVSFKAGSAMLKKFLGIDISESQVRNITEYVGESVYRADTEKANGQYNELVKLNITNERNDVVLYIMIDGAAINTRIEDKDGSTWRECKSAIAFTNKDLIKRKDGSKLILNKECVSLVGRAEDLKKYLLMIAILKGYDTAGKTVVISDGATWIRNICKEIFPDAVQILDLYHLKENIYSYAKVLYTEQSKYTKYAETLINWIEQGKKDKAIKKVEKEKIEEKLTVGVVNLKTYLTNNYDKIDYPQYIEQGYYVGSGAMESANKVLVQRRLRQAGMRWSVEKSQNVVSLRTKVESDRWYEVKPIIENRIEKDYLEKQSCIVA